MPIDCEHPNHQENIARYSREFDSVQVQHIHTQKYGKICGICAAVESEHIMEKLDNEN